MPADVPVGESWGAGRRFGLVPIREGIYWYTTEDAPAGGQDDADPRPALLARFARWHAPVEALISATAPSRILRTDIFDRAPVGTFTQGRVALLSDAAHPMTPNLGQGACQAIEDAVVLARSLAGSPDVQTALRRYDTARVGRTGRVVENAWRLGRIAQWTNPIARGVRDVGLALTPSSVQVRSIHWLYDFC